MTPRLSARGDSRRGRRKRAERRARESDTPRRRTDARRATRRSTMSRASCSGESCAPVGLCGELTTMTARRWAASRRRRHRRRATSPRDSSGTSVTSAPIDRATSYSDWYAGHTTTAWSPAPSSRVHREENRFLRAGEGDDVVGGEAVVQRRDLLAQRGQSERLRVAEAQRFPTLAEQSSSASASSSGKRYGSTSDAQSTWRTANSQRAKYRSSVKSAICTATARR